MAVRNFWIEANIDGRATKLCGGARAKTGGMNTTIYQRKDGKITTALEIRCFERDGKLYTRVFDANHNLILEHETER